MKVYTSFRAHFSAGHRLHNPRLDEAANRSLYGKCNNPNGHGHHYLVEVTLVGEPDPELGRFVDVDEVTAWFERTILCELDHRNLNLDVSFLKDLIPTAENIAQRLFELVEAGPYGRFLHEVRLFETENNIASVRHDRPDET